MKLLRIFPNLILRFCVSFRNRVLYLVLSANSQHEDSGGGAVFIESLIGSAAAIGESGERKDRSSDLLRGLSGKVRDESNLECLNVKPHPSTKVFS